MPYDYQTDGEKSSDVRHQAKKLEDLDMARNVAAHGIGKKKLSSKRMRRHSRRRLSR